MRLSKTVSASSTSSSGAALWRCEAAVAQRLGDAARLGRGPPLGVGSVGRPEDARTRAHRLFRAHLRYHANVRGVRDARAQWGLLHEMKGTDPSWVKT